ncbi:MAG TPA: hypothetical protein VMM92_00050 [Thermoanaerobaculia bacterium]|nr:hypothetical protein [Thermoanaerobaculia bacterium]
MTPEQEDAAVAALRALARAGASHEALVAASREWISGYHPVGLKAQWVYGQCYGHPAPPGVAAEFYHQHLASWQGFLLSAALAEGPPDDVPEGSRGPRKLFLAWHFPEYPRWLRNARTWGLLLLVARISPWMAEVAGRDALCNFQDPELNFAIPRALKAGRPILAMFDYCYPDSHSVVAPFLGRPARTPAGLLKLAGRFGYEVQVVSARDDRPAVLDAFDPATLSPEESASRANAAIEAEIRQDPPCWLLWAMADYRWQVEP